MKKLFFVLLMVSVSAFAQEVSPMSKLSNTILTARVLCPGYSRPAEEVRKCTDEATAKATEIFNDLRKQYAKNSSATAALKNYFSAAIASMRLSGSNRAVEEQTLIRLEELFWLLKIEAGAI